jgi:hypothetical protein
MAKEVFRKLFRRRQRFIRAADDAVAEAAQISSQPDAGRKLRNAAAAAKRCERAATLYRSAGLGLLAKEQFAAASRYYCLCRDHERARLNQERWTAVPTYWEDDKTA